MARRSRSSIVDIQDWRTAGGIGMLFGMIVVGVPQLIGCTLLIGVIAGLLQLIARNRI